MAYTTPRTWVTGETVTASLLNTHVRDNFNATAVGVVTTKGDIAAATAANTLARVAVGANGAALVADSAASAGVRWSNTTKTASGGVGIGVNLASNVTAAANSNTLIGLANVATFAKGAFTGLIAYGVYLVGSEWSVTGAGTIATAYTLFVGAPTVGTANWSLYVNDGNSRLGGTDSKVFIGDTENASMTAGLTINQGANSGEIVALKSSSVAHGITDAAETDTFASLNKYNVGEGGLSVRGYAEGEVAIELVATHTTDDTGKTTAANAGVEINVQKKSGTSVTPVGANGNLLAVKNSTTTRFILDGDGDSHQDVGTAWTNFDDHNDAELLTALSVHVSRENDPIKRELGDFITTNRERLEALRLVTFNDDGHHFVNMSRLTMLLVGAVRQVSDRLSRFEKVLLTLGADPKLLAA